MSTRAKAQGKRLGRQPYAIGAEQFDGVAHLSRRDAGMAIGVTAPSYIGGGCHGNLSKTASRIARIAR